MENTTRKVLLVEDDKTDAQAFERFVESEKLPYDYQIAYSVAEGKAFLASDSFDVIIIDYTLGDGTGFEILKMSVTTPHVLVTGTGDENLAVKSMKEGALDYLVKDHNRHYLKALPVVIENVIRRKQAEESREQFHAELAALVVERGKLINELEHARKRDKETFIKEHDHLGNALRALDKVLGVVGHELRTPLAGLRAMSEFLLTDAAKNGVKMHPFMRSIHDEIIRMAGMVNDLLEVARLNSGTAKWNWSVISMADACNQALVTAEPLINKEKVTLSLDVTPPELSMKGDSEAIRRLVLNLIGNAQKHTSEGFIRVKARSLYDQSEWVELEISDSGQGIPAAIAKKLGEAFVLNSGVVGDDYVKGSGLGLAICKSIVAAHGGTITVASQVGCGSVVTVRLRADLDGPIEPDNSAVTIQSAPYE